MTDSQPDLGLPQSLSRRTVLRGSLAAAAGIALTGGVGGVGGASEADAQTTQLAAHHPVHTRSGLVTGTAAALPGVIVYKGLPYAASTAGPNRFRAPQPAPSWSGVRHADTFGPACPQPLDGIPDGETTPALSEDCLNLNVWTSARTDGDRHPVFLWLYGGRNSAMWASQPVYDGAGLARKGVVVVTINYRVGVFGGLATPELSTETGHHASGNWALLDQVAALRWVRRNIAAFGGDPDRVTVAGWSHGAASTYAMIDSPLAKGLFHRAQLESGVQYTKDPAYGHVAGGYITLDVAEQRGTAIGKLLGATTTAELRALPADTLAQAVNNQQVPEFRYVLDGWVFPKSFHETLETRSQNDVPVLTGNNKDENGAFPDLAVTLADYRTNAATTFGTLADEYLALYPATSDTEATAQSKAFDRDEERVSTFLWGTQWLAAGRSPAYTYYWTHALPTDKDTSSPIMDGVDAAGHGAEMNYIFGNLYATDRAWTAKDHRIADRVSSYVANFAATGNPNHAAGPHHRRRANLPHWAKLQNAEPVVMEIGDAYRTIPVADSPAKHRFIKRWLESQTIDY